MVADRIPNSADVPALVALLSEQITDVKTSIDELKQGLSDGLNHLEVRLDDHAVRLTALERSEIRREEAERVKSQMYARMEDVSEANHRNQTVFLSRAQMRIGWAGALLACVTIVLGEVHTILT